MNRVFERAGINDGKKELLINERIKVGVAGCGICAGDLKCQHGAAMFWGDEKEAPWVKPPFIPGHEFVGRIVKMGAKAAAANGFSIGDRITAGNSFWYNAAG